MRRVGRLAVAASLAAVLATSACSPDAGPEAGATPAPVEASSAATPVPDQSGTPTPSAGSVATRPAQECLTGRYGLVRFVAVGGSTYGTGQGGDVTVTFDDGRYSLAGAGEEPMVVTVGGQSGNLTVDGESRGTYALQDATATFTAGSATGRGTLDDGSGGRSQRLTMEQVDSVIGLAGDGQVACTAQALTITLDKVRLELGRV